jgi:hypothetical protein
VVNRRSVIVPAWLATISLLFLVEEAVDGPVEVWSFSRMPCPSELDPVMPHQPFMSTALLARSIA